MSRRASRPSMWRKVDQRPSIGVNLSWLGRPLGLATIALAGYLLLQIPGGMLDGHRMTTSPECASDEARASDHCLKRVPATIIDSSSTRRSAWQDWDIEVGDRSLSEDYEMTTGGSGASSFAPGDDVWLLFWESEPVAMETADGEIRTRALGWGHGQWLWKFLLAPILLGAGVAWFRQADEPLRGMSNPAWLLLPSWVLGAGMGLLAWVTWGGVPSTAIATVVAASICLALMYRWQARRARAVAMFRDAVALYASDVDEIAVEVIETQPAHADVAIRFATVEAHHAAIDRIRELAEMHRVTIRWVAAGGQIG